MEYEAESSHRVRRPWLSQPSEDVVADDVLAEDVVTEEVIHKLEVPNNMKPKLNQTFVSPEEAAIFYGNYAAFVGFDSKIGTHKRYDDGSTYRKKFCCSREGYNKDNGDVEKQRKRGLSRVGCKARMSILHKDSAYIVTTFDEEHNHMPTTPTRKYLKKQNRKVSRSMQELSASLSKDNVPVHQQMSILEIQSGGIENVGFLAEDLYNHQRDIHAVSRRQYGLFGDVLIFDTTFNTNQYSLIFAPILGVNNHGQTIVFGCAFLSNESADSFVWLFEEFKKAMPRADPQMIITDQDLGMTKAIAICFPEAIHRYCSWHILNKFPEKFGTEIYKTWGESFKDVFWNSFDKEEFDEWWTEVVGASGLGENEWLQGLFEICHQWVPVYVNHVFSAGMTSSQRAESAHAFFKRCVSKRNTLNDFVTRFNQGIAHQRHQNLKADHRDIEQTPKLHWRGDYAMENQIAGLYTSECFYEFQVELLKLMHYHFEIYMQDESKCVYKVWRMGHENRKRDVVCDKVNDTFSCNCRKFESKGILYVHILLLFHSMRYTDVPSKYILPRWKKNLRDVRVINEFGEEIQGNLNRPTLIHRGMIMKEVELVIEESMGHDERTKIAVEGIRNTLAQVRLVERVPECSSAVQRSNRDLESINTQHVCDDPLVARPKGCGKRLMGGAEKAVRKPPRLCKGCLKKVNHDSRNCPKLKQL